MSNSELMLSSFICSIPAILILGLIVLGLLYANLSKKYKTTVEQHDQLVQKMHQSGVLIANLRAENRAKTLEEWFKEIRQASYRNEIEVEVKFIYPLVQHLGYKGSDIDIRVPVDIQVGRNSNRGEADWVLWGRSSTETRHAHAVIEAKAPYQDLNTDVQAQSRSYAFALNAPIYLNTNGRRLQIFHRGIQNDKCVVDCEVKDMASKWTEIQAALQQHVTGT